MNSAVIYARYSSDKQTEDSIEAQLRACRDYATAQGLTVVGVYKGGHKREGLAGTSLTPLK